ncbi:MAG: DUF364 domain-containing protein [Saccharolobus sp.]|uniref:Heavy-metal chelation domain-containing protein n=1 Tax=Saccharolobus shibatae (strain ATCC 51178 / DSM 5389 / JCM 8931 / NBRC 15437 / B12) TaxID=523848 RepID=A0A8F5GUN7_SACSH|nr:DUF364 domain-containing protein [Saccharolobus shibatae]MCH4814501.1 DUF364 domain-containing protein [Saccharolobus shibatae]QXJ30223.1 Uncharacterized protein J5U23_03119 [Saccharolobus shibatae B12]
MILREVIEELSYQLKQRKIINVCVSPTYTSVMLDDQSIGISHTITDGEIEGAGEIIGKNAYDVIINNLDSNLQRSLSLAILNALGDINDFTQGDPINLYSGGKLCVFGFSPQLSYSNFDSVIVYDFISMENKRVGSTEIRPFSSLSHEVCSTALIFASSLVNNTIDRILSQISANHLILTGISSVDAPISLKNHGFEALGKLFPIEKYRVFRTICEGGSSRLLSKYMTRYFKKL